MTISTEAPPALDDQPVPEPVVPSSRRAERRLDQSAERADERAGRLQDSEQKRLDREHRKKLRVEARNARVATRLQARADRRQARAEKDKLRFRRRKERRAAWQHRITGVQTKLSAHMPLWGLPVIAVSLVIGWTGQAQAATSLGMGWASIGVPVLTEGMTMTFAGLTAAAIEGRRPYQWLLRVTCASAVVAACVNAVGHLAENSSAAGIYRASAYAGASMAALLLWVVVMASKRAVVSGRTAEDVARWKRLRRRHPILVRRAHRLADAAGIPLGAAYERVWTRKNGAAPGEPSIREIRAARRAAYRRAAAESWDGRSRWSRWNRGAAAPAATCPAVVEASPDTVAESIPQAVPAPAPAPVWPAGLVIPGADGITGSWVRLPYQPVVATVSPLAVETGHGTPGTRFPQGREPVSDAVRESVADDRLEAVRGLVAEVAQAGGDLRREPSVRATAKRIGCRPVTAREYLATVLAERGITRTRRR